MEHDLPIHTAQDLEALQLINQIPDETVYGLNPEITNRLGLNHMTDILSEDLNAGRLRPEQLNQMSIEKAIRRVAEYDAEKARIAAITEADRIKDLPTPITYNKDYKWLELKHPTDPAITKEALKSEGNQMGHCVGTHCDYYDGVMNGSKQIFSLRDANNKPHVTIETNIIRDLDRWLNANKETIANDPKLSKMIFTDDFDEKYSKTGIEKIPKKYENHYYVSEYDGLEKVEIDYTKYELDILKKNIKEILENNSIDNDEKINQFKKIC
jgi:hypothetical protein